MKKLSTLYSCALIVLCLLMSSNTGCTKQEDTPNNDAHQTVELPLCQAETIDADFDVFSVKWVKQTSKTMSHAYDRPWADQTLKTYTLKSISKASINKAEYLFFIYQEENVSNDPMRPKMFTVIYDCLGNQICMDDHLLEMGCDVNLDAEIQDISYLLFEYYYSESALVFDYINTHWTL